jgi:hypothetical protein
MAERRFDAGRLGKIERTPQGGARVPAALTRTGVLPYRNQDGSTRLEFRPPSEVFRADSLATLRGAPVIRGHVAWITAENWKEFALGHVSEGSVRQDGALVAAELVIQDADTLKRLDAGEDQEISLGYSLDYDPTPGTTPEGQRYDGVQRNVRVNHVALLPPGGGRAGRDVGVRLDSADPAFACDEFPAPPPAKTGGNPEGHRSMNIRFDGKDYDVSKPEGALALQQAADKLRQDALDAIKARDVLQGKVDAAVADEKKRLDAAEANKAEDKRRLDAAVAARVELETAARTVLGADFDCKSKSDREIMVSVVRGDSKDFDDKDRSDDYVRSRFDSVIEKGVRADSITTVIQDVAKGKPAPASKREDAIDPDAARAKKLERNSHAWKGRPAN